MNNNHSESLKIKQTVGVIFATIPKGCYWSDDIDIKLEDLAKSLNVTDKNMLRFTDFLTCCLTMKLEQIEEVLESCRQ